MNQRTAIHGIVLSLIVAVTGQAVIFSEAAQIAVDDYTNAAVTIDGCVLTINGPHSFSSFEILNGGSVTHSSLAGLQLTIAGDMVLEAGASINVDDKGYAPKYRNQNRHNYVFVVHFLYWQSEQVVRT